MASSRVRSALLAALLLTGIARAQTRPVPELADYAVLGLGDVTIRADSRVASGAVGSTGGTVRLGRHARVANVVAAPTVRLGPDAHGGTVFCHFVNGPPTLPNCNAFVDPLVDPALLAPVPVTPGASDFRLPPHTGTAPVPAGSFRDVVVGRGSVLQLYGGTYAMASLRVRRSGRVGCVTECRIGVLGTVAVGPGATVGALAPLRSNLVRIDVAGSGPLPVFVARARADVSATVFAPAGDVVLGPQGSYRGAVVGRTVVVGPAATVRVDSAL
jgi:hypothetical protein